MLILSGPLLILVLLSVLGPPNPNTHAKTVFAPVSMFVIPGLHLANRFQTAGVAFQTVKQGPPRTGAAFACYLQILDSSICAFGWDPMFDPSQCYKLP